MNDFEIAGRNFKIGKIDAFKQFHIVRRIGPILSDLLPSIQTMQKKPIEGLPEDEKFKALAEFVTPIMNGLSKLSDEDANLVLLGLLQCAEMQQVSGNWARVANSTGLMIQDLELPILLQVAGRAFMHNLSGFFGALPQR